MKIYVILHNIRSAENVGAIFRTADGAGVSKMYLTGYTPGPLDRFGRENEKVQKTSLGATHTVPYEAREDVFEVLRTLTKEGVRIVGVETAKDAIDYRMYEKKGDVAFVFGNEITGVPREILDESDAVLQIPMKGTKESLNVSVCAGIILFHYS